MSTILATGGLGFIGSHTTVSLLERGFDVLVIDSLVNSKLSTLNKIKQILNNLKVRKKGNIFFRKGDIRNKEFLENLFNEFKENGKDIGSVIHFAGLKCVEQSNYSPLDYWDVNLNGTLNLLKVMKKNCCRTFLFSSSATVYQFNQNKLLSEGDPLEPFNPYGNTKFAVEKILHDLYKSEPNKWKIINLRYFNPVGSHPTGLIGEDPNIKPTNLFPVIQHILKRKANKLQIFGNDWPTKDGTCVRDYVHVVDLAEAHVAAYEFINNNKNNYISLNIGTGRGTTVLELLREFNKVNNLNLGYEFLPRRKGDSAYVVADNKLAIELLNWMPKKTLGDMCRDSYKWTLSQNDKNNN